ncbi:prephenate dehydratase [Methanolobus sp. ZRKC3]|uniref:prephenate dehydratase n=1 Tax=Methanolobus sp. ZRKC3 TaxID=3125786 RepID=UPI00324E96EE
MNIGVLGPKGSYSEKAAKQWLAGRNNENDHSLEYFDDIQDVFSSLSSDSVDIGVVPLENSIEGSVGVSLDMLLEKDVAVIGETVVTIEHCLLSRGKKEDIKIILSHPQGLAQCRQFLKEHFEGVELRTTGSTSHAAKLATEFPEMAAIASKEAARMYGLDILIPNVQDRRQNHTRFFVIVPSEKKEHIESIIHANSEEHEYKTSIIVYLDRDRPGALYEILAEFAQKSINLTRIESRPSKEALGDYVFYIDFEGYINDANIKGAIYNIESKVGMLKMLGSYPKFIPGPTSN